jgi:hypothetical protein
VAGESGVATAANAAGIEHESRQATLSLGVRL